jgi:hypothetical protein
MVCRRMKFTRVSVIETYRRTEPASKHAIVDFTRCKYCWPYVSWIIVQGQSGHISQSYKSAKTLHISPNKQNFPKHRPLLVKGIMRTAYILPILLPLVAGAPALCKEGNPGAVYLCSEAHFQGKCYYLKMVDYCYVFESFSPASFGPDPGGYCTTHLDSQCATSPIAYQHGGAQDISNIRCPGLHSIVVKDPAKIMGIKCFLV